jgi:hypothetical protein
MLKERLQLERDALLKKIEDSRKSSGSVAQGYYKSVHTGVNKPFVAPRVKKA